MIVQFLVATAIRWAGLAALATLVGSLVVDVLVLPRAVPELGGARGRLARIGVVGLVVLVGTTAGELVTRAQTMAGGDLAAAIPAIPVVLTRTHFGAIWIGRFVALVLALLSFRVSSRAGKRLIRVGRLILLGAPRIARGALPSRLRAYVGREAVLVVLVLGCTAVLGNSTPARHAGHAQHQAALERGPFRVTMQELHESGGVPEGWILVPPPGDAGHGREVFVRLGCEACHRVKEGKLANSSGLGPDLTGAGERHPAGYLLESILNPNAVIVQAPGYTGPDGKSIMPDYRGQLSVGDLIDLVAYLKSL